MTETIENLAQQFRLSSEIVERARALSRSQGFNALTLACGKAALELEVEVDYAPVMESPSSYLAKLEHEDRKVLLNGVFLEKQSNRRDVFEFLKQHEVFHYYCLKDSGARARLTQMIPDVSVETLEEQAADIFALATFFDA